MSKISELSDGGVIQGGDTLIAVRSGGNVKVTYGGSTTANIDGGTIDGTVIGGTTPAAGNFTTGSFTGNVSFGDNDRATFGESDDLQIYHDGSNSIIKDGGTGNLNILAGQLRIKNPTDAESLIEADVNGAVRLYHDNSLKLATTSTGVDVTGTVTADKFESSGNIEITASSPAIQIFDTDVSGRVRMVTANAKFNIHADFDNVDSSTQMGFSLDGKEFLLIDDSGDISFYDDTGTTAKFYWDASAEFLGIGTTAQTTNGESLRLINGLFINTTGTSSVPSIAIGDSNSGLFAPSAGSIAIATQGGQRLTVDPTGQVGINTSDPTERLNIIGDISLGVDAIVNDGAFTIRGGSKLSGNPASNATQLTVAGGDAEINAAAGGTGGGDLILRGGNASKVADSNGFAGDIFIKAGAVTTNGFGGSLNNGEIVFETAGTEVGRWDSAGHLIVPEGITLGTAVGTYNADNTLNDYEEGTFTPTYTTSGTDFSSITYDTQDGFYTKVGNMVNVRCFLRTDSITVGSASGNVLISGLPFTAANSRAVCAIQSTFFAVNYPTIGQPSGTTILLYYQTVANGTNSNALAVADLDIGANDNGIILSLTYQAT